MYGKRPATLPTSEGLIEAARTATMACVSLACGNGMVSSRRTSGPPNSWNLNALIGLAPQLCFEIMITGPYGTAAGLTESLISRIRKCVHSCAYANLPIHSAIAGQRCPRVFVPINRPMCPPGVIVSTICSFLVPRYFSASNTCSLGVISSASPASR